MFSCQGQAKLLLKSDKWLQQRRVISSAQSPLTSHPDNRWIVLSAGMSACKDPCVALRPLLVSADLVAPVSPSPGAAEALSKVTGPRDPPWTLLLSWGRRKCCERVERLSSVGRQDGFSRRTRVFVTRSTPAKGQRATAETVSVYVGKERREQKGE